MARSRAGVPIRLTRERWQHITSEHPELGDHLGRVLDTIDDPDTMQVANEDELLAVRRYDNPSVPSRFLVVAYREVGHLDGFVITASFTRRPSTRRATTWTR